MITAIIAHGSGIDEIAMVFGFPATVGVGVWLLTRQKPEEPDNAEESEIAAMSESAGTSDSAGTVDNPVTFNSPVTSDNGTESSVVDADS